MFALALDDWQKTEIMYTLVIVLRISLTSVCMGYWLVRASAIA